MEQRGITNPHLTASQQPDNHLRHPSSSPSWPYWMTPDTPFYPAASILDDHQNLALDFSGIRLSSPINDQTLPFRSDVSSPSLYESTAGHFMGSLYCPPMGKERGLNCNNAAGMRAQNVVSLNENMLGLFDGAQKDFSVGPRSGVNNLGGGLSNGVGGVDLTGSSHEAAARLNADAFTQRGYEYGQYGPYFDNWDFHPFLQGTNLMSRKANEQYMYFPQNCVYAPGLMDGLASKHLDSIRSNYYDNKLLFQWKQHSHKFSIEDFRGRLVSLAKDQIGSKVLQMKIEEQNVEENELVLSEVIDYVGDLLKNQFGSYFIQKLFGVCNEEQRTRIIVAITNTQLVGVCLSSHGAKAMQTLLENLNSPQQISLLMSALSPLTVALANDPNGQHVIQFCVVNFSFEFNKHLLNEIAKNCFGIATNKSGCCVLQSCVERSRGEPRERLINEIIANAVHLVEDPFGNYVVQHLLGLRVPEITADLVRRLQGYFASLSCNKFASNVVEKFLVEAGEENATTIIKELLACPNATKLLVDPYGNFVIQSALSVSKGRVYSALLDLIMVNAPSIRNNMYAKKIFAWFDKRKIPLGIGL